MPNLHGRFHVSVPDGNRCLWISGVQGSRILDSRALGQWTLEHGVELRLIQPGKPTQDGFIENINGRFRDEYLNEHWFSDISHARKIISEWSKNYNEYRPHSTLNYLTPFEFAAGWQKVNSESEGSNITN